LLNGFHRNSDVINVFDFHSKSPYEQVALLKIRYYSYSENLEDRIQNTVDRIKHKKRKTGS